MSSPVRLFVAYYPLEVDNNTSMCIDTYVSVDSCLSEHLRVCLPCRPLSFCTKVHIFEIFAISNCKEEKMPKMNFFFPLRLLSFAELHQDTPRGSPQISCAVYYTSCPFVRPWLAVYVHPKSLNWDKFPVLLPVRRAFICDLWHFRLCLYWTWRFWL